MARAEIGIPFRGYKMSIHKSTGCMFMYEATQVITINAVDEYHAIQGYSQDGCNDGVTFLASLTGAISSTADNGGVLRCTDVAHGLTTGNYISLNGMGDAAHVGVTAVTVIDPDTFDCDDIVYNSAADTGFWQRGSSLTVDVGHGGVYDVSFTCSILSAVNNRNVRVEIFKNAVELDEIVSEVKIAIQNDLGPVAAGGPIALTGGDVIWAALKNTTAASDFTIEHANINMHRL